MFNSIKIECDYKQEQFITKQKRAIKKTSKGKKLEV